MFFIQGGSRMDPAVWAALNSTYAPDRYLVDLSLNGQDLGKQVLDVTPQDSEALCLPDTWQAKAGVNIRADFFKGGYDAERQCHVLTRGLSAWGDFDMSTQSLALTLPP